MSLNKLKLEDELIKLADKAAKVIIRKKNTVAIAESVTSGNIQAALSLATNAISFYQGGITVYNIGQKCRHLLIEPTHAIECNCVSQKVSNEMAIGVAGMFSADIGIGITGYASPVPEEKIKNLFAYVSVSKHGKIILSKKITGAKGSPHEAQLFFTKQVLKLLPSLLV